MDFKVRENILSKLSARFNLMVALVFGLLITNLILGLIVWRTTYTRQIEITPFFGNSSYFKSAKTIDFNYLNLMAENFIYLRLNLTPESIGENHKRLLSYVNEKTYPKFLKTLNLEAKIIKIKKISSHFLITKISSNTKTLTTKVSGILKRSVGLRALPDEKLSYILNFTYHHGRLAILSFMKAKAEYV